MKKIALQALSISALALCMSAAYADYNVDRSGSYFVSPAAGVYSPGSGRNASNSLVGTFSFGYNFSNYVAAQLMLGGGSLSPSNTNGQNQSMYLANVEGLVNMPTNTAIVPYVALGMGTLKVNNNAFDVSTGLGVNYYLAPTFAMGLNYRHLDDFNNSISDDMLTAGLTWTFGGNSSLVVSQPQQLTAQQQAMLNKAQSTLHDVLPNGVVLCNDTTATPQTGCVTIAGDQMTMHLDVKFANNKAAIVGSYPDAIDRLATFLNAYPTTDVTLYGYASKVGTEAYNLKLSLRRAENVKSYLVNKGIDASRIQTVGMGTKDPVASNETRDGRAKNRRVQADVPVPVQGN